MLKIAAKANDQGILDKVFQHQNHQGQTAVDILMSKGNVASIQKLLSSEIGKEILMMHVNQHGSKVLSEIKNGNGNSLVHLAAEQKI